MFEDSYTVEVFTSKGWEIHMEFPDTEAGEEDAYNEYIIMDESEHVRLTNPRRQ